MKFLTGPWNQEAHKWWVDTICYLFPVPVQLWFLWGVSKVSWAMTRSFQPYFESWHRVGLPVQRQWCTWEMHFRPNSKAEKRDKRANLPILSPFRQKGLEISSRPRVCYHFVNRLVRSILVRMYRSAGVRQSSFRPREGLECVHHWNRRLSLLRALGANTSSSLA